MSLKVPPNNSGSVARNQRPETADQDHPTEGAVILQPVTMRVPNTHGIYSPSKLRPLKAVSYEEFLSCYAIHPRGIRICLDETASPATIFQKSKLITAYGFGLDCWYIVISDGKSEN
jgi:hypothetical protein